MDPELVQQMYDLMCGNIRLCERLNAGDDDADVEIIINSFFRINVELCKLMFRYGAEYGKEPHMAAQPLRVQNP